MRERTKIRDSIIMKIAITGKGGVGKTTITVLLARVYADDGQKVLLIDGDPDANLARSMGIKDLNITPLIELDKLIEERTGAKPGSTGAYFKLNPEVSDIPDKYCINHNGVQLLVMGTIRKGGGGCACPENTFLKSFLRHILLERDEIVIIDMAAGIEHLGRGTAESVDKMLVIVEPSQRSVETAYKIKKLSMDIGVKNLYAIANKVRNAAEEKFLKDAMPDFNILGFLPYDDSIIESDRTGQSINDKNKVVQGIKDIRKKLEEGK